MTALTDRRLAQRFAELDQRLRAAGRCPCPAQAEREDVAQFLAAVFHRAPAACNSNQPPSHSPSGHRPSGRRRAA